MAKKTKIKDALAARISKLKSESEPNRRLFAIRAVLWNMGDRINFGADPLIILDELYDIAFSDDEDSGD